jgi:hypothetical protein
MTGSRHSRTVCESSRIFRPYTSPLANHKGSSIHGRTIWHTHGLSGYAYIEQELHNMNSSHTHHNNTMVPPTTYYNHSMPPHVHKAEYSSATREPERYRGGGGGINRIPNTHLRHPWEESRQNDVRQPEFSPTNLMDVRQTWWKN